MTTITTLEFISTPKGEKTILNALAYSSYQANRGYGMTHEQLVSIGIGNDEFKARYEQAASSN